MPAFSLQDDCQILYILLHINESDMMIKAQTIAVSANQKHKYIHTCCMCRRNVKILCYLRNISAAVCLYFPITQFHNVLHSWSTRALVNPRHHRLNKRILKWGENSSTVRTLGQQMEKHDSIVCKGYLTEASTIWYEFRCFEFDTSDRARRRWTDLNIKLPIN